MLVVVGSSCHTPSVGLIVSIEGTVDQYHLLPFQNVDNFVTLSVSFGRDTNSHWSLLPGVCARVKNLTHNRLCVTYHGLQG